MAGVPGFEPGNAGIKTWCLTRLAIPHPLIQLSTRILSIRKMAGVPGFEPGYARIKPGALTAWRYSPPDKLTTVKMVREARLELAHLAAPEPKSGASTSFATPAKRW